MLPRATSYEALVEAFRRSMPERFNIATACCERWSAAVPDRVALIGRDANGGENTVTFAELKSRSDRLAHALRARGLAAGDRLALLLPQSSEAVVGHFAAYKLGAIMVPLAVLFGPDALRYRLRDSGAKAILTDGAGVAQAQGDPPRPARARDGALRRWSDRRSGRLRRGDRTVRRPVSGDRTRRRTIRQ